MASPTFPDTVTAELESVWKGMQSSGAKGSRFNCCTPEFKDEAVRYWKDSGKSVHECAGDLGVKPSTFARWVTLWNRAANTDDGPSSFSESARMRQLEKENAQLKAENSFLKKAAGYFASMQK